MSIPSIFASTTWLRREEGDQDRGTADPRIHCRARVRWQLTMRATDGGAAAPVSPGRYFGGRLGDDNDDRGKKGVALPLKRIGVRGQSRRDDDLEMRHDNNSMRHYGTGLASAGCMIRSPCVIPVNPNIDRGKRRRRSQLCSRRQPRYV